MGAKNILVISHRRSGTHWTLDTIRNNFDSTSKSFLTLERLFPWHKEYLSLDEFQLQINVLNRVPIIKTHLLPTLGAFKREPELEKFVRHLLETSKVVYVYRDGRDVLVSLYYYVKSYNRYLNEMSFSEFIRMTSEGSKGISEDANLNRIEFWKFHVEGWLSRSDIFELQYEKLHSNYEETVDKMAKYIELEPGTNLKRIELPTYRKYSNKLSKTIAKALETIKPVINNQVGQSSAVLPRKGLVGAWKEYFSEEDLNVFNEIAGDLMQTLDY